MKVLVLSVVFVLGFGNFASQAAETTTKSKRRSRAPAIVVSDQISSSTSSTYSGQSESGLTHGSRVSGVKVRPIVGMQFFDPSDVNGELKSRFDNNSDITVNAGAALGVAAEYPLLPNQLYAGIRLERFSSTSSATPLRTGSKGSANASISGTPLMATLTYLRPVAPKTSIGLTAGAGLCLGYTSAVDIEGSDVSSIPTGRQSHSSTPFTGLVALTGVYDFTPSVGLRFEGGFRLLSSSEMKADGGYPGMKEGELLIDRNKKKLSVDASGFYTGLSLNLTL